jgi:hypothetical protein
MTFEETFRDFWWLMFPIFGMCLAVWGMIHTDRHSDNVLRLIKSYTDQGKEPPPELIRLATQDANYTVTVQPPRQQNPRAWTAIVFVGVAAGFGTGWYMVRNDDIAFAFAIVAVTMAVMAVGALLLLLFGRK